MRKQTMYHGKLGMVKMLHVEWKLGEQVQEPTSAGVSRVWPGRSYSFFSRTTFTICSFTPLVSLAAPLAAPAGDAASVTCGGGVYTVTASCCARGLT
jgi:hypothetical protein